MAKKTAAESETAELQENRGRGRPEFDAEGSRELVRDLVLVNCNQDQICGVLGIGKDTLRKYYSEELENARHRMSAIAANCVLGAMVHGKWDIKLRAAQYWLGTQCGFRFSDTPKQGELTLNIDLGQMQGEPRDLKNEIPIEH